MQHPAYTLLRTEHIDELGADAHLYQHRVTGAEILSVCCDDDNKVFGVTFRTPPSDSTGVAHILEHSVLGGSQKYPVKEPFKELLKSSVNTFLNAMTYSDKTVYPTASKNLQDFYNLMDVYLDAVFFPTLSEQTFEQEGWHLELDDPAHPLAFKGVVFNEMKGVYSSPDSVAMRAVEKHLMPDSTYGHDSGGDPLAIPDLSFEQFVDFHRSFYHPANSRIWFYGDDDPGVRLERLDQVLQQFDRGDTDSTIILQDAWSEARRVLEKYVATEGADNRSFVQQAWILGPSGNREETALLGLLNYLLTGQTGSPLRKALMDSGLGEDLFGYGFYPGISQMIFNTGLKGVEPGRADEVFTVIFDTLNRLAEAGFSDGAIEAAMNSAEFKLRENNTGRTPRGLVYMLRSLNDWLYDRDPIEALRYEELLVRIKQRIASEPRLFPDLIRRYLVDNPHRLDLEVNPDSNLAAELKQQEQDRLNAVDATLAEAERDALVKRTRELIAWQERPDSPEALASIPTIQLADINRSIRKTPITVEAHDPDVVVHHPLATQNILYLQCAFDLRRIPQRLIPLVPLFGRALTEMGTARYSYEELAEQIARKTGGISESTLTGHIQFGPEIIARSVVGGKCMLNRADDMLGLMEEILMHSDFSDRDRFLQILLEEKAGEEAGLIPSGHTVVRNRLNARFGQSAWFDEQVDGVSYLLWLRDLIDRFATDWDQILADLNELRDRLITRAGLAVNVTVDLAGWKNIQGALYNFLSRLPAGQPNQEVWTGRSLPPCEGLILPAQVNYVGRAYDLKRSGYEHHASVSVISRFLRNNWLWDRVRVKGGAYGAISGYTRSTGILGFASYRDPNVAETFEVYEQAADFLRQTDLSDTVVEHAIIGMTGDLDQPKFPDAEACASFTRYLCQIDDGERQRLRDEVLGTRRKHFVEFANALEAALDSRQSVVLGNEETMRAAVEMADAEWVRLQ